MAIALFAVRCCQSFCIQTTTTTADYIHSHTRSQQSLAYSTTIGNYSDISFIYYAGAGEIRNQTKTIQNKDQREIIKCTHNTQSFHVRFVPIQSPSQYSPTVFFLLNSSFASVLRVTHICLRWRCTDYILFGSYSASVFDCVLCTVYSVHTKYYGRLLRSFL